MKNFIASSLPRRNGGFTLAEMLIVLAILAITTTIAVQSLAPLANQTRIDATQQTLTTVRAAVVGPPNNVVSPGATSGFVADMGRLPQSLGELLLNPSNASTPQTFSADQESTANASTVTVISGWKGPYLTTPVGQTAPATIQAATTFIVDGWGRVMNGPASFSGTDWTIWSSGPNGVDDSSAMGLISGDDIPLVIYPTDYQANSITVTVNEISSGALAAPTMATGDYVEVYLYTVNGGNVTHDQTVVNSSMDGLVQLSATAKITYASSSSSSYSVSLTGSQPNPLTTTLVTPPTYSFTFSPGAASPSPPLTLNVGTIVLQAAHYSSVAVIKTRSMPIVTSLTPRVTLTPTLVMQ